MSRTEGELLRDEALDRLEETRTELIHRCQTAMIDLYWRRVDRGWIKPYVSGDDATKWLDRQHCTDDYRLIGAVFRGGTGWIPVGFMQSKLKRRHARPIQRWKRQ